MTDVDISAVLNDRDAASLARFIDADWESDASGDMWYSPGSNVLDAIYTDEDWGKDVIRDLCWIAKDAGYPLHFDGSPADDDWDGFRSALAREVQKRSDPQPLPSDQT